MALESPIVVNPKGGKQSHVAARYDLVPPHALETIAKVLSAGAEKYDIGNDDLQNRNWHLIPSTDHINHALAHIYTYLSGAITGEDDMANATCRLMMALEMLKREGKR